MAHDQRKPFQQDWTEDRQGTEVSLQPNMVPRSTKDEQAYKVLLNTRIQGWNYFLDVRSIMSRWKTVGVTESKGKEVGLEGRWEASLGRILLGVRDAPNEKR